MASAAEEKTDVSAAEGAGSPGGLGNKITLALTAVNLLATIGMVAILFISFEKEKNAASVADIAPDAPAAHGGAGREGEHAGGGGAASAGEYGASKPSSFGKMVTLEQFTVNLSTPGSVSPKFVRVNISLELPNEDAEAEVTSKMPQVRNVVIDLFNSKRPADLATAEGRDSLKEEIRNAISAFLVTGKVKGVFFTSFAMTS